MRNGQASEFTLNLSSNCKEIEYYRILFTTLIKTFYFA